MQQENFFYHHLQLTQGRRNLSVTVPEFCRDTDSNPITPPPKKKKNVFSIWFFQKHFVNLATFQTKFKNSNYGIIIFHLFLFITIILFFFFSPLGPPGPTKYGPSLGPLQGFTAKSGPSLDPGPKCRVPHWRKKKKQSSIISIYFFIFIYLYFGGGDGPFLLVI